MRRRAAHRRHRDHRPSSSQMRRPAADGGDDRAPFSDTKPAADPGRRRCRRNLRRVANASCHGLSPGGPGDRRDGLSLVPLGDDTRFLAELGLILLMFMVGLEFSLGRAARGPHRRAGSWQPAGGSDVGSHRRRTMVARARAPPRHPAGRRCGDVVDRCRREAAR